MFRAAFLLFLLSYLVGCDSVQDKPVTIAINPWPGYEKIFLADAKGFFQDVGANIQLIKLSSLTDVQRAYLNGNVDGMASTIIEAVQVSVLGNKPLQIVMIPDYSNGADVIIGQSTVGSLGEMKGKRFGAEVSSLGIYFLQRALVESGLTLDDVTMLNLKQEEGLAKLSSGQIDAFVTYPPFSYDILKNSEYKALFTSDQIPYEIIDAVSISKEILDEHPELPSQLRTGWQKALDYYDKHPEESLKLIGEWEGDKKEDYFNTLSKLILLTKAEQDQLFKEHAKLTASVLQVCETLVYVKAIDTDCENMKSIVSQR